MNLCNTIVHTHLAPKDYQEEAHHYLKSDVTLWNHTPFTWENAKYHQVVLIVKQGFMAHITALFYVAMQHQSLLTIIPELSDLSDPSLSKCIKNVTWAISCLTPEQFLEIVEDIQSTAFTIKAWSGMDSNRHMHSNIEF